MRFLVLGGAALSLLSCATPTAGVTGAPSQQSAAPQATGSSRTMQILSSAGGANAASRAEVERALGAPDIERRDGAGAALTYRLPTCALLLLFSADQRDTMRLREVHADARHAGAPAPSQSACAAEAEARRR